jgi:hypothetical protein
MQILSIGTGLGGVVSIKGRLSIIKALKNMATKSREVAVRLDRRFKDDGQYFRFNVERGLEDTKLSDWEKASTISGHTKNYVNDKERHFEKFVESFSGQGRASMTGSETWRPLVVRHELGESSAAGSGRAPGQ